MEILNVTMERLGLRSNRRVLIVYYIVLPSLLMGALLMYQISNFGLFEGKGLYKTNVLEEGKPLNVTDSKVLEGEGKPRNVTTSKVLEGEGKPRNVTASKVLEGEGKPRNVTASKVLEGEGKPRNVTASKVLEGEGKPQNVTASMVLEGEGKTQNVPASKVLEGRSQSITASSSGSKNESYIGTKVDSSPNTITRVPMVKLLGGLLAPGFDEGTCISRYHSYLYHKASPRKPSPYLISKLRNYEDLHKQCGPHSKSYNKTVTRLIKNSKINFTTRCSYIVWKGSNGLGNRMISLSSVFLYAVLTDRVLLVEFRHDMSGLFCEPFPNSSWEFPENILTTSYLKHIQTYESLVQNNMANTTKWVLPSILYLNLQHSREHDKLFHCDHSQDLLRKIPALILLSDQYFVPSLFMTPYFKQELSKMFPEKGTIFHHMGRYLFHPSNKAWRLISSFYDANLAKADEKIGLQIRVFNTRKSPYQTIMASILECTLNNKLLPELDMRKSVPSPTKNRTFKSVFVASLHSEYAENLKNMYWRKPTVTGEIIQVYQASHEGKQKPGDNIQNMKAWSEIYLLSLCDVLVTSSKSTFGYVAQGLGGLKPWILYRSWGEKIPKLCQQALSMEPCFHYPPKSDCNAKNKVDITSVFPYMKACEDFIPGVKLVD